MAEVEVEDLWYTYPDGTRALQGVTLQVFKGESVALLGPNGAGKTTLILHLNGLFTPMKGRVRIQGEHVEKKSVGRVRRKVGLVFQDPMNQLFCPTLWEEVAFGPQNLGLGVEEVEARVKEALMQVGLTGLEGRDPHHLSVGERRRAALATVLAMKPSILIPDEPTADLDAEGRRELVGIIKKLHREGVTIMTVTQDADLASRVAERIFILKEGNLLAEGSPKGIFSNPRLLYEAGLEQPPIPQLFTLLKQEGHIPEQEVPLTVEEAAVQLRKLLKEESRRVILEAKETSID